MAERSAAGLGGPPGQAAGLGGRGSPLAQGVRGKVGPCGGIGARLRPLSLIHISEPTRLALI
eukprot:8388685-Alexandrium_andersonii.AAC.1